MNCSFSSKAPWPWKESMDSHSAMPMKENGALQGQQVDMESSDCCRVEWMGGEGLDIPIIPHLYPVTLPSRS